MTGVVELPFAEASAAVAAPACAVKDVKGSADGDLRSALFLSSAAAAAAVVAAALGALLLPTSVGLGRTSKMPPPAPASAADAAGLVDDSVNDVDDAEAAAEVLPLHADSGTKESGA